MENKAIGSRAICFAVSFLMLLSAFLIYTPQKAEATASETTSGFYVDGTTIRDANGNAFLMRGVNHAYAWFKDEIETAVKASAELGSNTVRIVIADGQQWDKVSAEEVERLILLCIKYKVVPIFEVHDITGNNRAASLNKTVNYWLELKDIMNEYEKYVILNIANEWMGQWNNGSAWAEAYKSAITTLREAGINNMIVVDAPGWGQDGGACGDYCEEVFDADPNENTVFSIHMYGSAGGSQSKIKNNIDGVIDKGLPLIIGEFGYYHSDGDVDEDYIMEYCTEKNVGYIGWSWKGNGGGVEYLDIAVEWDGSVLSEDWGENLFNNEYGIKSTAEICSIYTDGTAPEVSVPDLPSSSEEDSSETDESTESTISSEADSSSKADDSSKDDSGESASSSKASGGTTTITTGGSGTAATNNGSTSASGSDSSANTGATALAFIGVALSGAAIVITKKNK